MEKEKFVVQPYQRAFVKSLSASALENMKRQAKKLKKEEGIPHHEALNRVAKDNGHASWEELANAAFGGPTPPIGTPSAGSRGGNSTPTVTPVEGVLKSPVISPVSGE